MLLLIDVQTVISNRLQTITAHSEVSTTQEIMITKEKTREGRKIKKNVSNNKNKKVSLIVFQWMNITGLRFTNNGIKAYWSADLSAFCFLFAYVLQIIAMVNAKDDPDRLFECFSVISFCGMGILKLFSLRKNHKQWLCIINKVRDLENREFGDKITSTEEYALAIRNTTPESIQVYTNNFLSISQYLSKMYTLTAIIYVLSPFMEYGLSVINNNDFGGLPHVLPGWAPLDDISIIGYIATVLLELIAAIYCVCIHIAFDLTSIGLMIFVCGQFSLIRDYSENIGREDELYDNRKARDDRAHFQIIRCHKTHILIIACINELGKLLQNILGVYFFVATLTLCSVAVRVNSISCFMVKFTAYDLHNRYPNRNNEMSAMQLASLIQYMCATLTQLFLFCFYGDKVFHETSVGQGEGPFGSAYWQQSVRVRKELLILAVGMAQPRRLKAGPFTTLDLPSFIQVIRSAYSYYAVIRNY